jgi:hypothetical protein
MTTQENLDYIDEQRRGARFYCPATHTYNLTRAEARELAEQGFDVINEDDITLSV